MEKSDVEKLFALQEIDDKLRELEHKMNRLDDVSGAKALADELKSLQSTLKEIDARIDTLARRRDELDERSRSLMTKVKSMKAKETSGAISHRDIASTELEISNLESQRSDLEDEELEILSEIEGLEPEMEETQRRISGKIGELEGIREQNATVLADLGTQRSEMDAKRLELSQSVDPVLLKLYGDIYARVGTMALARVENGNCQGCRLKLSAVEIESVKRSLLGEFTRPPTCEQCGRILYA